MDSLFTIVLGLGFRFLVDSINHDNVKLAASLVGLWEGFVVGHYLSNKISLFDRSIAYAFRMVVDYVLTRNYTRMMLVLLWTGLGVVLSDIIAPNFSTKDYHGTKYKSPRPPARLSERVIYYRVRFHSVRTSSSIAPKSNQVTALDNVTQVPPRKPPSRPPLIDVKYTEIISAKPSISDDPPKSSQRNQPSIPLIHDLDSHPPAGATLPSSPTRLPSSPPFPSENVPPLENTVDNAETEKPPVSPDLQPIMVALAEDNYHRTPESSKDNTPTTREIELVSLDVPAFHPIVDRYDRPRDDFPVALVPDVDETASSVTSTPNQDIPGTIVNPEYSSSEEHERVVLENTINDLPLVHPWDPVPAQPIHGIPSPDIISIDGSEQTVADQESIMTVGSRDFVISRADFLRSQAIAEERERDRLNGAMMVSFREGRIRDGILLGFDIEEADEKSRRLHEKAARRHFYAHNLALPSQTIDVHRLRVPEAIRETNRALREILIEGGTRMRVIVGRGKHSRNKMPVLKPAIIAEMKRREIPYRIDPYNDGILIIEFS